MGYSYDHDCPFEAFITNLGKYNEGELVGEWVKFPTTAGELKKMFERIGIGSRDDFGNVYEEWFISDYDCYVDGLSKLLGEYENLDELNYLASKIEELDETEYEHFLAAMEISDYTGDIKGIINLTDNLDKYDVYPDVEDYSDLGRMYIEDFGMVEIPEHLRNYIDYEAYGRDIALDEISTFSDYGYVRDTQDSFVEYYDGDPESIPEEYRIMNVVDDEPEQESTYDSKEEKDSTMPDEATDDAFDKEEKKITAAMELAYEIDTFFRRYDIEYSVMFPDESIQQIALHDCFFKNDTSSIKNGLINFGRERDMQEETEQLIKEVSDFEKTFGIDIYFVYQLKHGEEYRDFWFEPLERLEAAGKQIERGNYELVYCAPYTEKDSLEDIYTKLNMDCPDNFHGHSLSVSDIVVLCQGGQDQAYYCDRFGFQNVTDCWLQETTAENVVEIQEERLVFYVAECMEFPIMGEYHEDIATLQEAMEIYKKIPAERINGIKGIGFRLHGGDSIYDGCEYTLMSGGSIWREEINEIQYFKDNLLIQKAISDIDVMLRKELKVENHEVLGTVQNKEQRIDGSEKKTVSFTGTERTAGKAQKAGEKKSGTDITKEQESRSGIIMRFERNECHVVIMFQKRAGDGFTVIAGFIRTGSSGTVISLDTTDFHIEGKAGKWLAYDSIIVDGKEFFLMEHTTYGADAANVVLDEDGKLVVDQAYHGFDETVCQQIKEYLRPAIAADKPENPHKNMGENRSQLETWQKYYENGEYLRSAEITEEQNYNMIDGRINNLPTKPRKIGSRISVLDRLHLKQEQIAKRSGNQTPQREVTEDMERRRK